MLIDPLEHAHKLLFTQLPKPKFIGDPAELNVVAVDDDPTDVPLMCIRIPVVFAQLTATCVHVFNAIAVVVFTLLTIIPDDRCRACRIPVELNPNSGKHHEPDQAISRVPTVVEYG